MYIQLTKGVVRGVIIGLTTAGGLLYGATRYKDKKNDKKKLGILGMQRAGKTRFLSYLRNEPFIDKSTEKYNYKPFTYKIDGKKIHIDKGEDIGGGNIYRYEYNCIIKKSDVIFYFFDISKYLNNSPYSNEGYRRACNSRIEHINSDKKESKNNTIIVGTHIDLCSKSKAKVKSEFLKLNENKSYYPILKNIELIDLTDEKQIQNFTKKVFK